MSKFGVSAWAAGEMSVWAGDRLPLTAVLPFEKTGPAC